MIYGDYHAAWWGDPQHGLASWPVRTNIAWVAAISPLPDHCMDGNNNLEQANITYATYNDVFSGSTVVWHMLDEAGGVDVGTIDIGDPWRK